MGFKTQTLLVRPGSFEGGPDKLLADLGYAKCRRIDDTSFSRAGAGSIWIGEINDCIVIHTALAWSFFDDARAHDADFTFFKNALFGLFPEADIAALVLHSIVNGWGFAVFRRGIIIRRQHGYDGSTLCDEGPRLPAEDTCLAKFDRIEAAGEVRYRDPLHPEYDQMIEADFGESFVFEVCRSFTGFSLDAVEMNSVFGTNFWLNDDESQFHASQDEAGFRPSKIVARPWWRFW